MLDVSGAGLGAGELSGWDPFNRVPVDVEDEDEVLHFSALST